MEEKNVAIPGSSNMRIARKTFIDLMKYKPELAIIVWSDPSRFEFCDYRDTPNDMGADALQLRISSVDFDDIPGDTKKAVTTYYKHLSSYHSDLQRSLYNAATIKNLADSLGITCIQLWFRDACIDNALKKGLQSPRTATRLGLEDYLQYLETDPNIWLFDPNKTFETLGKGLLCAWDDHPSEEAHDHVTEYFKQWRLTQA